LLVAGGTVLHVVESYLPALGALPGAKLGLANVVTLLALMTYEPADVWKVVGLRVFLGSLLGGTFLTSTFFLSTAGAVGSATIMMLALKLSQGTLSTVGVSILGAVAHNLSQLAMAVVLIGSWGIFFYLPYLLLFALPTGYFIGVLTRLIRRALPFFFRMESAGNDSNRQDLGHECGICS
jgi:heptaprenyl diphosphate synthase